MESAAKIFEEYLTRNGLRMTQQRRAIFGVFYQSDRHLSAEEIYDLLKASQPAVGIATVWRNMKLIRRAGLAEEHHFRDGRVRYEKKSQSRHGHMICTECGRPVEFKADKIIGQLHTVAEANSFKVQDYRVSLFGICFLCRDKQINDQDNNRNREKE